MVEVFLHRQFHAFVRMMDYEANDFDREVHRHQHHFLSREMSS
jgi:hypothetical protein